MDDFTQIQSPEQVIIKDEIHENESDLFQIVKLNENNLPQIDHDIEIIKEEDVLNETGFFLQSIDFFFVRMNKINFF